MIKVRFKKLVPEAVIPTKAFPSDAGFDLTAVNHSTDTLYSLAVYHTGIAVEIPEGYVGLIFPRSSISRKDIMLYNSVGVIDSHYRGELILKFYLTEPRMRLYHDGDRIGQLIIIPYPEIEFEEAEELSETDRGDGSFGSSGR